MTYLSFTFHRGLQRAGLPRLRIHDLRHTAATHLLTKHVHPKVVQELLGHSTIAITLDTYSHVMPALAKEASAAGGARSATAPNWQELTPPAKNQPTGVSAHIGGSGIAMTEVCRRPVASSTRRCRELSHLSMNWLK